MCGCVNNSKSQARLAGEVAWESCKLVSLRLTPWEEPATNDLCVRACMCTRFSVTNMSLTATGVGL